MWVYIIKDKKIMPTEGIFFDNSLRGFMKNIIEPYHLATNNLSILGTACNDKSMFGSLGLKQMRSSQ